MTGLDWPGLMRAGLSVLRLRPDEFWALTPAELFMMLGLDESAGPLDRAQMETLMARFPDTPKGQDDG